MNRFEKSQKLLELVEGKRVVLVGPSNHLQGLSLGEEIDKYDVVCRVNDYPQYNIDKDYGSKTDIVFDSCDTRINEDTKLKMIRFPEKIKKIKLIIAHCVQANHGSDLIGIEVQENLKNNNIYNIPTWWIGVDNFNYIETTVGKNLNSGMLSIQIILEHNPKELFITGFSFYLQWDSLKGYYSIYRPGYNLSPTIWTNYNWGMNFCPQASHNHVFQMEYFKNVMLKRYKDVIKIDSYLKDLLKIDYENVVEIMS